jgi:DNA-binding NarL/FixJ family response regulator
MINLILADDHSVVRQAIGELLSKRGSYNILAEAADGRELLSLLSQSNPDIVIMDVAMPELDGLETLRQLSESGHAPPVLVLSADEKESSVRAALRAGAKGYVPKNIDVGELEFAIGSILSGRLYLSPSISAPILSKESKNGHKVSDLTDVLTRREIEILALLADGRPNREIGKLLHISTRTVDTHRSNILKKLKVKTNAEMTKIAIAHGLVNV